MNDLMKVTAASLPFSFWNTAFSLGTLLKSTRLHSSSSDTTTSGLPTKPHQHQIAGLIERLCAIKPMTSVTGPRLHCRTSLGNANWYDLLRQHARLKRCFAAAVRADGVRVLLLSGDAAVLGCVLCTVALLKTVKAKATGKRSNVKLMKLHFYSDFLIHSNIISTTKICTNI